MARRRSNLADPSTDGGRDTGDPALVPTALRAATRTIQLLLVGIAGYSALVGETGFLANTLVMLSIALLPDAIRLAFGVPRQPAIAFLVALAPLLHAVGAMGPYKTIPAFDQIAHAVSATLIAGLGYVVVRVVDAEYDSVEIPPGLTAVFVVLFATAFGVGWELLEFASGLLASVVGGEPLLAQYGPSDVVLDLLFNTLGALLVALWGTRYFDGLRRLLVRRIANG